MTDTAIVISQPAPLAQPDPLTAFADFLRLKVADGDASPATIRTYHSNVTAFYQWATDQGIAPAQASEQDVEDYRRALVEAKLSRATITARLAALARFFEAAQWRGLRQDNPAAGVKAPKDKTAQSERIKFLPKDGVPRLLATCPADSPRGIRDRAALTVFALHGPRVAELAALDLDALDLDSNPATLRIRGKGDKMRTIYLVPADVAALRAWLAIRGSHAAPGEAALFVTLQGNQEGEAGRRLSDRSLRRRVDFYLVKANLKRPGVSAHALRHSFATWASFAGVPTSALTAELGHASEATTGIYKRVADRIAQNPALALADFYGLAS